MNAFTKAESDTGSGHAGSYSGPPAAGDRDVRGPNRFRFVEVFRSEAGRSFDWAAPGVPGAPCARPGPADLAEADPDAHWLALDGRGAVRARCSAWWTNRPPFRGSRAGLLGHYSAVDARAGVAMLNWACGQLARNHCRVAIGPMDGSTWRCYRLVTWSSGESPFFLEPNHPPDWPDHFLQSGFTSIAQYASTLAPDSSVPDPRAPRARARLEPLGVTLRPIDLANHAADIGRAHEISLVAFRKGLLFSPLPFDAFKAQCEFLLPAVRKELVWFAEREGRAVGFVFAIPDLAQKQRGEPVDRVVVKTLAIRPERELAGLGTWLSDHVRQMAFSLGYRGVIHALIHDGNGSMNISRRTTTRIRQYTLFGRGLFGDEG